MINKLVLGTANFGLDYGIANRRRLSRGEIHNILECARSHGVWGIDTAKAYGDAEKIMGEYFTQYGKTFGVITKLPKKECETTRDIENEIFESLKNMNIEHVDFVLLHSYETYKLYGKKIIPVLQSFSRDKIIGCYGVSVYHPEEAEEITGEINDALAIEFPLNLFDRRFLNNGFIQKLKSNGNFLFARSVFLQGLFFLDEEKLTGCLAGAKDRIKKIKTISEEYNIKPEYIALLFVVGRSWLDGVIVGVDSSDHLMSNIGICSKENLDTYKLIEPLIKDLAVYDEEVILPYRWGSMKEDQ